MTAKDLIGVISDYPPAIRKRCVELGLTIASLSDRRIGDHASGMIFKMAEALELYTEKGYHNTTVDEIAKRAGVSTGIAYRYFKNKKEILLAALTFAFANLKEMVGISAALTWIREVPLRQRSQQGSSEGHCRGRSMIRKREKDFTSFLSLFWV